MAEIGSKDPKRLRELASWYRELAERAGSAVIWEARLLTAEDLVAEAERIEQQHAAAELTTSGITFPRDSGPYRREGLTAVLRVSAILDAGRETVILPGIGQGIAA